MTHLTVRYSHPILALSAVALLTACQGSQRTATPTTGGPSVAAGASRTAPAETSSTHGTGGTPGMGGMNGMNGMPAMGGMQGMGGGGMMAQMTPQMMTHMRMMQGASADSMAAMMPMHRQMMANMLARMNGEMRGMHMPADARWTATADSLRQDLVRMPELSAPELKAMMPAHLERMKRLMEMHRGMMGGTGGGTAPGRGGA